MHEQISSYMVEKGWYHAWDMNEQINLDLDNINTALNYLIYRKFLGTV